MYLKIQHQSNGKKANHIYFYLTVSKYFFGSLIVFYTLLRYNQYKNTVNTINFFSICSMLTIKQLLQSIILSNETTVDKQYMRMSSCFSNKNFKFFQIFIIVNSITQNFFDLTCLQIIHLNSSV